MQEYLNLVERVLTDGTYKQNRTDSDTISSFHESYTIDVSDGFPLLTTKQMSEYRWDSMIHELLWYFSGEHHIKNLREETKIWDAWADDDWNLPSAYGRFWRKYPVPQADAHLPGEEWIDGSSKWVSETSDGTLVFDQLQYVIDTLNGENPNRSPHSRRLIVNAWHPANASVSSLPPCHYTYVFNVQGDELNLHLTQRSGDIALGIPFNIAAYSLLLRIVAQQTEFEVGEFGHTIVDAHIYCGQEERGKWYADNLETVQEMLTNPDTKWTENKYEHTSNHISTNAPEENDEGYDHVPGLLEQLSREPLPQPELDIANKQLDELEYDDFILRNYDSHQSLSFNVAE